jgi:hypothetical protein
MMHKALEHGQHVADPDGTETAIRVDLLRRSARFNDARQLIVKQRAVIAGDTILKILTFQETLITKGDETRYTVSDALGEPE